MYFLLISLSSINFYLYSFVTINLYSALEVVPEKNHTTQNFKTDHLKIWFPFFPPSFPSFSLTQVRPITNGQLQPS